MAETLSGIGVSPGVAAGPVAQMAAPPHVPTDATPSGDPEAENQAAMDAMRAVARGLEERASRAPGEAASVLAAQAMMAEDPTLASKVTEGVQAGKAAVTAVADAFQDFRAMLAAAGPHMPAPAPHRPLHGQARRPPRRPSQPDHRHPARGADARRPRPRPPVRPGRPRPGP